MLTTKRKFLVTVSALLTLVAFTASGCTITPTSADPSETSSSSSAEEISSSELSESSDSVEEISTEEEPAVSAESSET